jgi:hypothetical protein
MHYPNGKMLCSVVIIAWLLFDCAKLLERGENGLRNREIMEKSFDKDPKSQLHS